MKNINSSCIEWLCFSSFLFYCEWNIESEIWKPLHTVFFYILHCFLTFLGELGSCNAYVCSGVQYCWAENGKPEGIKVTNHFTGLLGCGQRHIVHLPIRKKIIMSAYWPFAGRTAWVRQCCRRYPCGATLLVGTVFPCMCVFIHCQMRGAAIMFFHLSRDFSLEFHGRNIALIPAENVYTDNL